MSANVLSFAPTPFPQEAVVVSNGDHRAALAATQTDRRAQEIERLPFDLSALEEEGVFINVDAAGFGILDQRLDWQALGVKLPEKTDVAFTPPGCVAKNGCLVLTMVDFLDPEFSSEVCLWPKPISSSGVTMSPISSFSACAGICATPSVIATSKK